MRNGEALVTDGPYAEVKESLGGYYLFSCDSLEEAIDWAAKIPAAWTGGAIEVRPVHVERGGGGMKYAMLVYSDQSRLGGALRRGGGAAAGRVDAALDRALRGDGEGRPGRAVGRELADASEAKVVRVVDGETIVTDGPFAETKELLGGIFVTELPDLDEAIRLAALVPAAEYGTLEIRPLVVR